MPRLPLNTAKTVDKLQYAAFTGSIISFLTLVKNGQVAQLVEQRTENPCVGGSIPPLATRFNKGDSVGASPKFIVRCITRRGKKPLIVFLATGSPN
jgi:hypothetical protein